MLNKNFVPFRARSASSKLSCNTKVSFVSASTKVISSIEAAILNHCECFTSPDAVVATGNDIKINDVIHLQQYFRSVLLSILERHWQYCQYLQ